MIKDTAQRLCFPPEAIDQLTITCQKITSIDDFDKLFEEARILLFEGNDKSFLNVFDKIAERAEVDKYEAHMVLLLLYVPYLKEIYKQNGLSEELLYETMSDLRAKLYESRSLKGVWGNFVAFWYGIFYRLSIFRLGRLEYEKKILDRDVLSLKAGTPILSCHIPSDGRLSKEDVINSLKKAYDFFPEFRTNGLLPILCSSWLLYPPMMDKVFPKGSNLYEFASLFTIESEREDAQNPDLWRVFNVTYTDGCITALPEDTSLRRSLKAYLLEGKNMGSGIGLLYFDGEKIVTSDM